MSRPEAELAGAADAWIRLDRAFGQLTEADARAPSRLDGWSRAHVIAHVWGNGEGFIAMVTAAADGHVGVQYPAGAEGRERDINGRAGLALEIILDAARASQVDLVDAWGLIAPSGWDQPSQFLGGIRPVSETALVRWRETVVHHVDLDIGFEPDDVPAEYRRRDAAWLSEHRPDWPPRSR